MRAQELKAWLLGPHEQPIPAEEVRHALRFVLAALRDTHLDDIDVWLWLTRPRRDLHGARPVDLLRDGRVAELEALVVDHWNLHSASATPSGVAQGRSPSSAPALHGRRAVRQR